MTSVERNNADTNAKSVVSDTHYKDLAASALFTGKDIGERDYRVTTLDNAIRGHYIEALIWSRLKSTNEGRSDGDQWRNAGEGWGLWDLQRGRHDKGNRVRFQVKIKADVQLWHSEPNTQFKGSSFTLGLNQKPPKEFSKELQKIFGSIEEPPSYRCDLFLLGWHGILPNGKRDAYDQTNPTEYHYFIVPVSELPHRPQSLNLKEALKQFGRSPNAKPWTYGELPNALDAAADAFLASSDPAKNVESENDVSTARP